MSARAVLESINKSNLRASALPEFRPGDSIKVWAKTRLQAFEGVCIRRVSKGARSTFTVRKISYGVGVERIFPDNSPNIDKIEVLSRGKVRQSKLYYLRDLSGKAARIKEREGTLHREVAAPAEAAPGAEGAEGEAAAAPDGAKKKRANKKSKKA